MKGDLKVVLFKSRNKDNKTLEGFKERAESFMTYEDAQLLEDRFKRFVNRGVVGELSRFYISVNARDSNKLKKSLLHYLIEHDNFDMTDIESKVVSLASKKENSKENRWLFDFDEIDYSQKGNYSWAIEGFDKDLILQRRLTEFLEDLECYFDKAHIEVHQTPNGYAVIVHHGFDTRNLLDKWENVTLKRDALLCCNWSVKV